MFVCVLVLLCEVLLLRVDEFELPVVTLLPFVVELLEERVVRVASVVFERETLLELLLSERTASVEAVPFLLVLLFSAGLVFALLVLSFVEPTLSVLLWLRLVGVAAVLLSLRLVVASLVLALVRVLFSLKSYLSALPVALVLLTLFERIFSG